MSITIFIADDHALVIEGLRAILKKQSDFEVIGSAADGREAVLKLATRCADIVLMDIAMPVLNGIEAIKEALEVCPFSRIIMLSMYSTKEYIYRALQAGARGYLLKEAAGAEVVCAIRTVHSGGIYLSRKIPQSVLLEYNRRQETGRDFKNPVECLSSREREVLQLVVEGRSSADIAAMLSLSPKTVESYRSRLMTKLDIESVPNLVRFALLHGLTPPGIIKGKY